jgi:hypothetical protein
MKGATGEGAVRVPPTFKGCYLDKSYPAEKIMHGFFNFLRNHLTFKSFHRETSVSSD